MRQILKPSADVIVSLLKDHFEIPFNKCTFTHYGDALVFGSGYSTNSRAFVEVFDNSDCSVYQILKEHKGSFTKVCEVSSTFEASEAIAKIIRFNKGLVA